MVPVVDHGQHQLHPGGRAVTSDGSLLYERSWPMRCLTITCLLLALAGHAHTPTLEEA